MKVFITGIGGFLGSHLADTFIRNGHEVFGIDNFIGGYAENIPDEAVFLEMDCLWRPQVSQFLKDVRPDIVIHAAALAYEGLSVFSPYLVTQNVYGATMSVLSASIEAGVKKFVFCSSMARYGEQKKTPFTESMTCNPVDPYGIAKFAAEQSIRSLCDVHDMEYVILVPHNIIGPRQKYDDPYRNVVSIMINRMLQNKPPIIYGDGKQKRCFSFISDVVDPFYKACFEKSAVGEVINIGPDEESVTIKELAERLMTILDFKEEPIYLSSRPCEVKFATCSSKKARKLLGYQTRVSLDEGLKSLIHWIELKGTKQFNYHLPLEIIGDQMPETWRKRIM